MTTPRLHGQLALGVDTPTRGARSGAARTPAFQLDTFVETDAFALLASLPDESIDLVITDPPYESLELHRSKGTTTRLVGAWFSTVPNDELPELLAQVHRVLKNDRHFYLFCDELTADTIKEQQGISSRRDGDGARPCACGLRYWREVIWAKTTRNGAKIHGGMGYHYRAACERIMFFEKGKRRLNDLAVPDVLLAPRPEYRAPAGKPLDVIATLVAQSTEPGEVVLDPFAGSGVVGVAAKRQGRRYLLGDVDDSYLLDELRVPGGERRPVPLPRTAEPDRFVEALVERAAGGEPLPDDAQHDFELFGFDDGSAAALIAQVVATRELERPALVRRFIRSSAWMRAARHEERPGASPSVALAKWLAWLDR